MEALDLLTVPQVSVHFGSTASLCSDVASAFPEMSVGPVAVLGLSEDRKKLVLSDPVVAVKRDGQLVCLWSQRTAREKIASNDYSRSVSPISRESDQSPEPRPPVKRISSLSSLASGGRVNHAGLSAALAELREENSRLKLEMSNFRGERSVNESDSHSRSAEELRSLRRRLMTLERRVSVERSLLAKRTQELEEREQSLKHREASVGRKERLAQLENSIPIPSPSAKPPFSRPQSSSNVSNVANPRRRAHHAWR